jgi:hypothetical protein
MSALFMMGLRGLVEMAFFRKIVEWWRGRLVPMKLDEEGSLPIISGGYRIRPWPARVWVRFRKWLGAHWQWFWMFVLGIVGLFVRSCHS